MSTDAGGAFQTEETKTSLTLPLTLVTIAYWAFIIHYSYTFWIPQARYAVVFVGGSVAIYTLNLATKALANGRRAELAWLTVMGTVTVIASAYVAIFFWDLYYHRPGVYFWYEYALALAFIAVVIYLAYRSFGLAFIVVAGLTVVYGLGGQHLQGVFAHSGLSGSRMVNIWVLNVRGFYGSITQIIASWVALFLLYTGLVQAYGAFDLILRFVRLAATRIRSGVAQFAVVASMIIGSINGSPSANSAMTGSVTIPMMKNSGMRSDSAAAVEATASSGGQVLPPVMGAAAFIMASLLGITYFDVVIAGLVPAVIFVVTVAIGVHYATLRSAPDGLEPQIDIAESEMRSGGRLTLDSLKFLLPFVVLVYTLGIAHWTVTTAAMATVIAQMLTGITFPLFETLYDRRGNDLSSTLRSVSAQTLEGFRYGAIILAPIAIIIALINAIVDVLGATGLPNALTLALMDLTGGSLLFAAVISMGICILLGMGMPSSAAYTIVAILVAPTFVEAFFLPELAAHYFVFYSALLSFITPPIATAVIVTSGIAGANFWRTCLTAIRTSIVLFVLPVAIVFNPELVTGGFSFETLILTAVVTAGAIGITHGINYPTAWRDSRLFDLSSRGTYIGLGLIAMVYPNLTISAIAVAVALSMFIAQYAVSIRLSLEQIVKRTAS